MKKNGGEEEVGKGKVPRSFIAGPIAKESLRDFFRIITAKQSSLTEVYPQPVLIDIKDVEELGAALEQKFKCYYSATLAFSAVVSFTNYRTREYPSWNAFKGGEWNSPDIIDSLTLRWEYLVQFEEGAKPSPFNISIRCGDGLKPHVYLQYMMSKDEQEVDSLELLTSPMSCRIDFSDPIVSQELLDLVARWHRARRSPEASIPGLGVIRKYHRPFVRAINIYTPVFTTLLALVALYRAVVHAGADAIVTNQFLATSLVLLGGALVLVVASINVSKWIGAYIESLVVGIRRTHVLEFTNGDRNYQTKLFAQSQRSIWRFLGAGAISVLWNVFAAALSCAWLPTS